MATRKRPLEVTINERTTQLLEPRCGRVRPRRIDPSTLPSMSDYGIRPAPSHVNNTVPDDYSKTPAPDRPDWISGDDAG